MKLLDLSALVKPMLARVMQPALVMHARRDHTCPMRKNVDYVMRNLGSPEKRAVELDESYHVITVDSEKERVAGEFSLNSSSGFGSRRKRARRARFGRGGLLNFARSKILRAGI